MPEHYDSVNNSANTYNGKYGSNSEKTWQQTFIHHPPDISLDYTLNAHHNQLCLPLSTPIPNKGGLIFETKERLVIGSAVNLKITPFRTTIRATGIVTQCCKRKDHYKIGVKFVNSEDAFRVRMAEQACHIQHYKNQRQKTCGKKISLQKAALEWIETRGASFPNPQ